MKRTIALTALASVVVLGAVGPSTPPFSVRVLAQSSRCQQGSEVSPEERQRRAEGLRTARAINTAQATAIASGRYQPLAALQLPAPASGFDVTLTTDGTSYAFAIKDKINPCRFAFFSDQEGLIYTAEPIGAR